MAQRFEGKNLEEALNNAAQTFGVERYQLTYHVLLEKRGFLGGMKRIVIEAEVNTEAPQQSEPATAAERPRRERERGRGGRQRGDQRGDERRDRHRKSVERREEEDLTPIEIPAQGPESEMAKSVREWCEHVI